MFKKTPIDFTNSKNTSPLTKSIFVCSEDNCVGVSQLSRFTRTLGLDVFPVGVIIDYYAPNINFTNQIPEGWALCDGSEYDIIAYSRLFGLLKKPTLPNLVGRLGVMKDFNNFGLLSNLGEPMTEIGKEIGVENEIMTIDTMPRHRHQHEDTRKFGDTGLSENNENDSGRPMATPDIFESIASTTVATGESPAEPINNRQPTITTLKIIKLI